MKLLIVLLIVCSLHTSFGDILSYKFDNTLTVHLYDGITEIGGSSYIIELPTKLIIYDAQFTLPDAADLLREARLLKKPIERVYVSHAHPDHYFGAEVFKGVAPIYALNDVIREIGSKAVAAIQRIKPGLKDLIPNVPTFPDKIQTEGLELIDGVLFTFNKIVKTESETALLITLPAYKIMFVGDLVFGQEHLFLAEKNFDNWVNVLRTFQKNYNFYFVFNAHGLPTTSISFQENINYLEFAKLVYQSAPTFEIFKAIMVSKYPYYDGDGILDMVKPALYP